MDNREVILTVECRERTGTVDRSVRLAKLDFERLKFLWENLKEFDTIFGEFIQGDLGRFISHFIQEENGVPTPVGLIWDVDDVGILSLTSIQPAESALVHFIFWDRVFRGREKLCIGMLQHAFGKYKFNRIQAEIPVYARKTMVAAERVGFIHEGRIRRAAFYKDDWFDVNVYSILPEEVGVESSMIGVRNRRSICFSCGETYSRRS